MRMSSKLTPCRRLRVAFPMLGSLLLFSSLSEFLPNAHDPPIPSPSALTQPLTDVGQMPLGTSVASATASWATGPPGLLSLSRSQARSAQPTFDQHTVYPSTCW
jgi:hypothetical protein